MDLHCDTWVHSSLGGLEGYKRCAKVIRSEAGVVV